MGTKQLFSVDFDFIDSNTYRYRTLRITDFMKFADSISPSRELKTYLEKYRPPVIQWAESSDSKLSADLMWCPGFLMVLSEKAVSVLRDELVKSGALLDLSLDNTKLYGYKTYLKYSSLADHPWDANFCENIEVRNRLIVNAKVIEMIENAGLTGFVFKRVL